MVNSVTRQEKDAFLPLLVGIITDRPKTPAFQTDLSEMTGMEHLYNYLYDLVREHSEGLMSYDSRGNWVFDNQLQQREVKRRHSE